MIPRYIWCEEKDKLLISVITKRKKLRTVTPIVWKLFSQHDNVKLIAGTREVSWIIDRRIESFVRHLINMRTLIWILFLTFPWSVRKVWSKRRMIMTCLLYMTVGWTANEHPRWSFFSNDEFQHLMTCLKVFDVLNESGKIMI